MKRSKKLTLDEAIIKYENSKLRNPILGGFRSVYPLFTDDHKQHVWSHIKFFYNPYTWVHIFEHFKMYQYKKKIKLDHLTNNTLIQIVQAQKMLNDVEQEMAQMPDKDTIWN